MPNVRCRFYDDETGAPIGNGCRRGSDCDFVHPSQAQWASARSSRPREQGFQNYRDRNGGGDRDRGYGHKPERTSANAIPTGPRHGRSTAPGHGAGAGGSSSAWGSSAWGSAPMGGTAWGDQGDAGTSNTHNASAGAWPGSSSTNAQASSSAAGVSASAMGEWGASQNDWEAPNLNIPWGAGGSSPLPEPVAGGWGSDAGPAAKAGHGWGDSPKKSSEHKDATRSSFAEPAPMDKDKGKARETAMQRPVASSPQVSFHTPQYDFATPRTPRSPIRSPQDLRVAQDPRRKMSMAAAPSDDLGLAARAAKEMQRERKGMRLSSLGVPVPTANAGPEGAPSKANPFAYPQYTPAESMAVSRNEPEPGQVREDPHVQNEDIDMIDETGGGESSAPQDSLPVSLKYKWKDFTRTLSKAVSLQLELKTLEDSREKQKRMHGTKAYQSASLVGVHKTLEELHKATDNKISDARKHLNRALDKLSHYPLEGLPVPSQDDTHESELEQVRAYVSQIHTWLEEVRPIVEKRREAHHQAELLRQQAEEEAKKAAEEADARAKAQLNKAKWAPITSERVLMGELREMVESLDGRTTDLEEGLDELRQESANPAEVVSRLLEERGYQKQGEPGPRLSQTPSEEGEVRPERPAPPRSYEELQEDMAKLKRRFKKADREFAESAKKLGRHEQSTLARKRDYFELARDNVSLNIKVQELAEDRNQVIQKCANNEKAIADLRALMDKHGASLPPPAPPPPTAEEITEKLKPVLFSELLPIVERALSRLKGGVEESMRDSEENICKQLFSVLQPAVAMVDTVKPVLNRHPMPDAPAPPAHTQSSVLMPPPPPPVQTAQHS